MVYIIGQDTCQSFVCLNKLLLFLARYFFVVKHLKKCTIAKTVLQKSHHHQTNVVTFQNYCIIQILPAQWKRTNFRLTKSVEKLALLFARLRIKDHCQTNLPPRFWDRVKYTSPGKCICNTHFEYCTQIFPGSSVVLFIHNYGMISNIQPHEKML